MTFGRLIDVSAFAFRAFELRLSDAFVIAFPLLGFGAFALQHPNLNQI